MMSGTESLRSPRRTGRRYTILLFVILAVAAGWTGFWKFAADKAQQTIDGWRAREAKSGRVYDCGSQNLGGFPFRIEVTCDQASAIFRSNEPPLELKADRLLVVAQVHQPGLIISEFHGPLTIGQPGKEPEFLASWKLAQSSIRGTPAAPQRASLVFDDPVVDRMSEIGRASCRERAEVRVGDGSLGKQTTTL